MTYNGVRRFGGFRKLLLPTFSVLASVGSGSSASGTAGSTKGAAKIPDGVQEETPPAKRFRKRTRPKEPNAEVKRSAKEKRSRTIKHGRTADGDSRGAEGKSGAEGKGSCWATLGWDEYKQMRDDKTLHRVFEAGDPPARGSSSS